MTSGSPSTSCFTYEPADLYGAQQLLQARRARVIEHQGREALHLSGIRDRFILPRHTLNSRSGTLVLWILPLDDLFPAAQYAHHKDSNRFSDHFTFLSDREAVRDVAPAQFCLYYHNSWHPTLVAKFHGGNWESLVWTEQGGAVAMSGHFEFRRMTWYQLVVTWDRDTSIYRVYANGVLVAHPDTSFGGILENDECGPMLYGGNPALAYGRIEFHSELLEPGAVKALYARERPRPEPELDAALRKTYEGVGLPAFSFEPDESWQPGLSVPFDKQEDLLHFVQQGAINDMTFDLGGLRIKTPPLAESLKNDHPPVDMTRMYLFSRRMFEGDLYVRMEFKSMVHGGLALLMTQVAGMQGESFLDDYFLRTDGSMHMVCWEDVRNYHWEFYREMVDTRNDLVTHACLKNPWFRPVSFQVENRRWETDQWYTLEFLQEGAHIRGAIDGITVMDATDSGFDNNGPVLLRGHVALRTMMRGDFVFRNLLVRDRPHVRTIRSQD